MKAIQVVPFISPKPTGTEKAVLNIASYMKKHRHEVKIVTSDFGYVKGQLPPGLDEDDIVRSPSVLSWERAPFTPLLRRSLEKELRDTDIVHAHIFRSHPTFQASKAAKTAETPFVLQPHGTAGPGVRGRFSKRLYDSTMGRSIVASLDCAIAISGREEGEILAQGVSRERIHRLPLWISEEDDAQIKTILTECEENVSSSGPDTRQETVTYLGQIDPVKGLDVLAHAFGYVLDKHPNSILRIAGMGRLKETRRIGEIVTNLGIGSRVEFLGFVESPRKFRILASSDVVVVPSFSESGPLSAVETVACGSPLVVSTGCGASEWVLQAGGETFAAGSAESCATGIVKILDESEGDRHIRKRSALWFYENRFTESKVLKNLEDMYMRNVEE